MYVPVFAALRSEHRVRAEYVAVLGQVLQKDLLGVGLWRFIGMGIVYMCSV